MRGNWDTAEPLAHAPNQQQQQRIIVEEQQHPLHSPTTPAWGIPDRIKEEPAEDKNNDSGVSPDHYTSNSVSPRSRRSSSTANCSLSPGSATSQDSNNMQCATFDYSPQRMFKNCGSPMDYVRHHPMDDHQQDQVMDVVSSTMKPGTEDVEIGHDTLQCPICAFTTLNRLKFTEHLATHCTPKCDTPDFMKSVMGQLSTTGPLQDDNNRASPTQGERSEHESEEADEPGLRVPRVNSQGKVKTFRCKQCNFVAITKLEFWEHSRGHIKAEKLLTCPKCPFVTEYKHHLEYHLRNHFGSKPFKCDKCSYSCVNKSMLNSHLKSHSNVYQYRCANCSYATKYCHSLKLHLRKYSHQPAMVLNADGSPNPLPIIDIYGTRRGPKQKCFKQEEMGPHGNMLPTNNNLQPSITANQMVVLPPQVSPVTHHIPVTSMNTINTMNGITTVNGIPGVPQSQPTMLTFPYNPIFAGFPLTHHFPMSEESMPEKYDRIKPSPIQDYLKTDNERIPEEFPQDLALRCFGVSSINGIHKTPHNIPTNGVTKITNLPMASPTPSLENHEDSSESKVIPLDLSKPDVTNNQFRVGTSSPRTIGTSSPRTIGTSSPRAIGTSRRKGRAVKLDRRVMEDDTDEEHAREEPEETFEPPAASSPGESKDSKDNGERTFGGVGMSNEFTCQYCEIAFGNVVMYTVHMGYHGYKDPYTCNMCGHECTDKVSFFLHIARSKHS